MPDQIARTVLQYAIDKAALAQVEAGTNRLKGKIAEAVTAAKTLDAITKIGRAANIDRLGAQYGQLALKINNADKAAQSLSKQLAKIGASEFEIERAVAAFTRAQDVQGGGGQSGSSRTGAGAQKLAGLVSGFGGGAIAEPLRIISDFTETIAVAGPVVAAVGLGIGAVTLALGEYNKQLEVQRAGLTAALAGVDAYYQAIASGVTSEEIRKQVGEIEKLQGVLGVQRAEISRKITETWEDAVANFGEAGAAALDLTGQLPLGQLREELARLDGQITQNNITNDRYTQGLETGAFATNDAVKAEEELAAARTKSIIGYADNIQQFALIRARADKLSTEQIAERTKTIEQEVAANDAAIKALRDSGDTSDEVKAKIQQYADANSKLNSEYQILLQSSTDLAKAREAEAAAIEKEKAALEFVTKQREELATAQQKHDADITKLESDNFAQRAELAKTYNDTLVDLAQEAAEGAGNALRQLQQDRTKLAEQLSREEIDAQNQAQVETLNALIEFQQEEERAARDHARNLKSIRDRAADSELKQIADRDFQSLFFSRRQTQRELNEASEQYGVERQEQQIALQQASDDRARQFAEERRQRQVNHQRQLNELQSNYNRELQTIAANLNQQRQLANQNHQAQLQGLLQKYTAELNLRQQAHTKELQFLSQTEAKRLEIITNTQNALLARAQAVLTAIGANTATNAIGRTSGGRTATAFATGGSIGAGQHAIVNDGRSIESFSAGGQKASFPRGLGTFIPSRAGNINPKGGQGGGNMYVSIQGSDPNAIWAHLQPKLNNWARGLFG